VQQPAGSVAAVELIEALRTTGAVREFTDEPVPDEVVYRVLDTARFAPSGGNRQAWRVVVVQDPEVRQGLRDLYLPGWYEYLSMAEAGLTPWAPITDRAREQAALARAGAVAERARQAPPGFAERLHEVPVLLVVLADLRRLAAVDRDSPGYQMIGGASVYPFVWNLLLAARAEGLGGVMTTMVVRRQEETRALLHSPPELNVAAVVALGRPVRQPRRLRRAPVEAFATRDRCDGPAFSVGAGTT